MLHGCMCLGVPCTRHETPRVEYACSLYLLYVCTVHPAIGEFREFRKGRFFVIMLTLVFHEALRPAKTHRIALPHHAVS